MWPSVCPGVKASRMLPSPNRSKVRAEGRVRVDPRTVEVDQPVVERVVVVLSAGSRAAAAAIPVVAAAHSALERTKVEDGNSEIPEAWSMWRWVITTSGIERGSAPSSRSCDGRSLPGSMRGRAYRAASRPKFSRGSAAIDEWRLVSTRIAPALGWVIRNAGHGTHHQPLEREVNRPLTLNASNGPPGRSKPAAGNCTSPPDRGWTVTVAPRAPPGSGSVRVLGSAWTFTAGQRSGGGGGRTEPAPDRVPPCRG